MATRSAPAATESIALRAFATLGSFRGDSALGTWLARIAINLALDARRTPQQNNPEQDRATTLHGAARTPRARAPSRAPEALRSPRSWR